MHIRRRLGALPQTPPELRLWTLLRNGSPRSRIYPPREKILQVPMQPTAVKGVITIHPLLPVSTYCHYY